MTQNALALLDALAKKAEQNRLSRYQPYPWQLKFHNAGAENPERMLMAGNRVGKTYCGAVEVAYHATGLYPDWWDGKRIKARKIRIWVGSQTTEASRDICQRELLGGLGEDLGTGAIPRDKIIDRPTIRQAGLRDVVDTVKVRHENGGISEITFKTYEQGWKKWMGAAPHVVWLG